MTVAYLVLAHHKPRQLLRLLGAIDNPVDVFAIHVDRKSPPPMHAAVDAWAATRPNVHVVPSRGLAWGGWSLAQVQLDAIGLLLDRDAGWTHFANLSGQDFPLRTPDAIRAALAAEPGRNHVDCAPIESFPDRRHLRRRKRFMRFERDGRIVGTPVPLVAWGRARIDWKGSGWYTITRAFCEWIVRDRAAQRCLAVLRHTYVPDEFLMQTLGMNGPFADTLTGDNLREILWGGGPNPVTLTIEHRERLLASRAHFARKFDDEVDGAILDLLDARLAGASVDQAPAR